MLAQKKLAQLVNLAYIILGPNKNFGKWTKTYVKKNKNLQASNKFYIDKISINYSNN